MPVIVPDDAWGRWLDASPSEPGERLAMLMPTDDVHLRIQAVGQGVNNVRNDGPSLIEPVVAGPPPIVEGTLRI